MAKLKMTAVICPECENIFYIRNWGDTSYLNLTCRQCGATMMIDPSEDYIVVTDEDE